ncbi:12879_t:CDS:2, partial [Racocetra fulgida]
GKSTIANVLVKKDKQFAVSSSSGSLTKSTQKEIFEENGTKYQVIDTIGLCDTLMTKEKAMSELSDTCRMIEGDEEECKKEEKNLAKTNPEFSKIIKECKDIIFVDNPPLTGFPRSIESNREVREYSRKKIIESFIPSCEKYDPPNLKQISEKLVVHFEEKVKLEKELKEMKE